MTPWLAASLVFAVALVPCFVVAMRGDMVDRLVGLEALSVVESLLFATLARALAQSYLYDVALALALLSFGSGLTLARFVERWL